MDKRTEVLEVVTLLQESEDQEEDLKRKYGSSAYDLTLSSKKPELQSYQPLSQFFTARCFFPAQIH